MASSEHIKALVKSHLEKDDDRFLSIALQLAAHEARIGHGVLAKDLRDILEKAKKDSKHNSAISIAKSVQDTTGLLSVSHPRNKLSELISNEGIEAKLNRIISEQRHMSQLKNHGLRPRRHILLVGPPGTGKTFTASILAAELDYPLFEVRLDALITKFMGESSAKLRQVFEAINNVRGVYFFDEFDALGSQRSSSNDVGEARRILNSFLQMIEQDDSNSLIICATNHIEILDHALFRRFDDVVRYELPSDQEIVTLLKKRLNEFVKGDFKWEEALTVSKGLSSAELTRAADESIKDMLINGYEDITLPNLLAAISDRSEMRRNLIK